MIGIKAIKPYITGEKISTRSLPEAGTLQGPELDYYNSCGIESIVDSGALSSFDLAKGATEQLLEETGTDPDKIDVIIYIKSRTPEYLISSEATRLKHAVKAGKAITFALTDLGCADISMALKMAKDFLVANRRYANVLIAYGNKQFMNTRFRYPVNILGDGGVAVLIGRTESNKIVDIQLDANGHYWDLFKLDYRDKTFENYREVCSDVRKYGFELAIESKNRFEELNRIVLTNAGLQKEQVNHFLLQNISARAYEYYESAFDIRISPVCRMNLTQYGHLGSVDIMLNYHTGITSGVFEKGSKVLIMNNSPVAAWSSMLVEV
jgi:3-oxoacyl-[acyl-carrier-protein] synthase III